MALGILAVRIDSAFNFLTAAHLERFITQRSHETLGIRRVLFCAGSVNDIDATGAETLEALRLTLKQVWDVLDRAGFAEALGTSHFVTTDSEATAALRGAAEQRTDNTKNRFIGSKDVSTDRTASALGGARRIL
jgi:SulP family sulfate permease